VALDLVVRGGTVITPQGVGPWEMNLAAFLADARAAKSKSW